MKILVLHGPNLNLFGRREPHIYGTTTLAEINDRLRALAVELEVELEIHQSNHEGVLVDRFHDNIDVAAGALLNPAALTQHGGGRGLVGAGFHVHAELVHVGLGLH
ncbi:MAG: type II 3-dehydroquinate dehydratase, partial [Hydrogenophaga sp.]